MKDILQSNQLRKKFVSQGAEALSDSELMAILLANEFENENVNNLSKQITTRFGSKLLHATVDELQTIPGIDLEKALQILAMVHLVKRYLNNAKLIEEIEQLHTTLSETLHVNEEVQKTIFDLAQNEHANSGVDIRKVSKRYFSTPRNRAGHFQIHNRRYLGNKYKLLGFIEDIVIEKCTEVGSVFDVFAGTGVVGEHFNNPETQIISNDFLFANYVCLYAFLRIDSNLQKSIAKKIKYLNDLGHETENYFSKNFGSTYFSIENAIKIGTIREEIEHIAESREEKAVLICSLLYAMDKVSNTVGHYDAFRKKLDMTTSIQLLIPNIDYSHNFNNKVFQEDANTLVTKVSSDIMYIDPPYNSRQYSDAYHLLENVAEWKKPEVSGIGKKMDRSHIKSSYCIKVATKALADLISKANCRYILLSYNNTKNSMDGRSNAKITDSDILSILRGRGKVEIFEKGHKAFTTGKGSNNNSNFERVFFCKVTKRL